MIMIKNIKKHFLIEYEIVFINCKKFIHIEFEYKSFEIDFFCEFDSIFVSYLQIIVAEFLKYFSLCKILICGNGTAEL